MPYTLASTQAERLDCQVGKAAGTRDLAGGDRRVSGEDTVHTPPSGQCLSPPQHLGVPEAHRGEGLQVRSQGRFRSPAYASAWQKR